MKGTTREAISPILLMPPITTTAVMRATARAVIHCGIFSAWRKPSPMVKVAAAGMKRPVPTIITTAMRVP